MSSQSHGEGPASSTMSGADNPAFVADEGGNSEQTLTTTVLQDTSEAPPDVLVDLEVTAMTDNSGVEGTEGETSLELAGFQPGESSTDTPDDRHGGSSFHISVSDMILPFQRGKKVQKKKEVNVHTDLCKGIFQR